MASNSKPLIHSILANKFYFSATLSCGQKLRQYFSSKTLLSPPQLYTSDSDDA